MAHSRPVAVGVTLLLLLVLGPSVAGGGSVEFIRGDADGSGVVSALLDALRVLRYLSGEADAPPCFDAADINGDGSINIVDPIWLLSWGFLPGGDDPPEPFPECGTDPDDDDELHQREGTGGAGCRTRVRHGASGS